MSTSKHKFYRRVLSIRNEIFQQGDISVRLKFVVWCSVDTETSRTLKTTHIGFSCFIGSKHYGVEALCPKKAVSISIKNPMTSKFFVELGERRLSREYNQAFNQAYRSYISATARNIEARVLWFDRQRGEGMITCPSLDTTFPVYACNLPDKKTWYPETACIYLEGDDVVTVDITGDSHRLFVTNVRGATKFDSEKWANLDQSRLAFKCDENGNAKNGLFTNCEGK